MKLEIELDLNKIDYEAINKQISEKIAALNIKDTYEIDSKVDNIINTKIKNEVNDAYNRYIDRYIDWGDREHVSSTYEGRELIQKIAKEEIECRTKEAIEKVFTELYDESKFKELVLEIMPKLMTAILFSRVESALFSKEQDFYMQSRDMIISEVENMLRR